MQAASILTIALIDGSDQPLSQQLYGALKQLILSGQLKGGERLPSTRVLSESLAISRNTALEAFDQLLSEGYVQASQGSGTYVTRQLPEELSEPERVEPQASGGTVKDYRPALARFGTEVGHMESSSNPSQAELAIDFRPGQVALDHVPTRSWQRFLSRRCLSAGEEMLGYGEDPAGSLLLREAISAYLFRRRGVRSKPEQVIIVNGSQQAIDLITRIHLDAGDGVVIENPGYRGATEVFRSQGARLLPISVDDSGLCTHELEGLKRQPIKLVYVTPSHQYPTGQVLTLPRRLELISWAESSNSLIVEDDYDSEYRYSGRPIPALQGLGSGRSVIYVGTFSKVLFPSMRIGYMVIPQELLPCYRRAKMLADRHSAVLEQYALADFILAGNLDRHIKRMRIIYGNRRRALVDRLKEALQDRITICGDSSGLHVMARIAGSLSDDDLIERARRVKVGLHTTRKSYLINPPSGEFVFGFAHLSDQLIEQGIERLARILACD